MNIQETIRRVLREEVSEAYLKPNQDVDKLINNWLEKLFSGSKMYSEETYKSRYDFEWCNNGKETANVILTFHNDDNLYNDVRPTSERDFIDGKLFIPKNIIDNFLKHLPMRRNYLRYKIEDWFEDNILPDITKKMDRTDIEINEIREYPEKAQVCVPPVEKPEDVTQDDMIDFIVKKTLFKRDELLRYEEEEPGFIEKKYLGKLRNAEMDRLRRGVNESELTEKCWEGYTQKGMKTMFGKRYPNCVKKTKK